MADWADLLWWHTWWSFDPNGSVDDRHRTIRKLNPESKVF